MSLVRVNSAELEPVAGPYSHAVRYNNLLYLSGITAFATEAEHGDIASQVRAIFEQINIICREQSTSLDKLIKVTIFVTSMDDIAAVRSTLFDIYDGNKPASSLVQVQALFAESLQVEVEAIVAV